MTPADGGAPTLYELAGSVATITLNRPSSRNALSNALVNSLGDDLARAAGDAGCRIVVLTNEGPAFCAGANLAGGDDEAPRWTLASVLSAILDLPKPVVGRIAGHCMGGGVGLAAACDLSVAVEDARFGFTEVRIGVAPAIISVVCLPKLRQGDAMELFLTGERIEARRAAEVGLITRAVAPGMLDAEIAALTTALVRGGPNALAAAKSLVRKVPAMEREAAFEWTAERSSQLFRSDEAAEGMASFRERRDPSWVPEASA